MWQNCRVATVKEGERDEQAWTQAQGSPQEQREPRQATQHLSRGSPLRRSWCPWHSSCPWCARGPTVGAARSDAVRPLGHKPSHSWGGSNRVDRKSTRLNSSHVAISYAVFCLKKKNNKYFNT